MAELSSLADKMDESERQAKMHTWLAVADVSDTKEVVKAWDMMDDVKRRLVAGMKATHRKNVVDFWVCRRKGCDFGDEEALEYIIANTERWADNLVGAGTLWVRSGFSLNFFPESYPLFAVAWQASRGLRNRIDLYPNNENPAG